MRRAKRAADRRWGMERELRVRVRNANEGVTDGGRARDRRADKVERVEPDDPEP